VQPELRWQAINMQGLVLQDRLRDLLRAEAAYRRAIASQPRSAVAHNNLGTLLRELGRREEAERSYREALRLDPRYVFAHNNLALLLEMAGRFGEALEHARRARDADPAPSRDALVARLEEAVVRQNALPLEPR